MTLLTQPSPPLVRATSSRHPPTSCLSLSFVVILSPDCAVCTEGFSPGYAHTCKSCLGDSKRRALAVISAIALLALVAATFLVAKLVSVVETGPPSGEDKEQSHWQRRCSLWQARMRKTVPLTAVKIVVVVWQIVTQVCVCVCVCVCACVFVGAFVYVCVRMAWYL